MKKIMFMLFCSLTFFSCEQEDVWSDNYVKNEMSEKTSTRSARDVPPAIEQLDGIPVNIKSVANGKYLSAEDRGNSLYLAPNDDGSTRQRWNIRQGGVMYRSSIILVGGNSSFVPGYLQAFSNSGGTVFVPRLTSYSTGSSTNTNIYSSNNDLSYMIGTIGDVFPFPRDRCMKPENSNSSSINFEYPENKGDLVQWDIIPVDEFEIKEITYELTTNDKLTVIPTHIASKTLINNSDIPAIRTLTFEETTSNESSFSELVGLKITNKISTSTKVGIAEFLNGEFSGETSSEMTWNYTTNKKEVQSFKITESVTQEVPPRTTLEVRLLATKYSARMTYIAELYGNNSGKTIYLKGKWDGAVVQESTVEIIQKGKVIKTIKLNK